MTIPEGKMLITNYSDTFTPAIVMLSEDNFSADNSEFRFLENLISEKAIENWIDKLTTRSVLKFDLEFETENDFI